MAASLNGNISLAEASILHVVDSSPSDSAMAIRLQVRKKYAMNLQTENEKLRFVLLFHQGHSTQDRPDHWDLMLEQDGKLLTWALEKLPAPGKSIPAIQLDPHRIAYLDYEGPISGERGSVSRVLRGHYSWKPGSEKLVAVLELPYERWEVTFRNEFGSSKTGRPKFLIEVRLV